MKRPKRRPLLAKRPDTEAGVDAGAEAGDNTRKCIATGELSAPERLVRFALDPNGVVTPDLGRELPGRGAWVMASPEAIIAAAAKGHFSRAFKSKAVLADGLTPEGLAAGVERGLEARALSALGLARRTGALVAGFEKARAALLKGRPGALVTASDAGADGAEKLARLAGEAPIVRAFSSEALSRALGLEGVVHAVLADGPEAARFLREAARLEGFRPVFAVKAAAEGAA